ncbi:mitogen activated protein kinase [Coemansia sp. RSA 989]|nr:mitogen activated protein kinase [Coemansia sp. RSA 1086]KAJ1748593.1 mitogen activated protein kinase [Coemansia sp. RSA 1821]KAJ1868458.1 mitogen activated protein kinase [Coemansia sp. RSA 989]KAJ1875109.1 mitogen activated protein kinase [Coemansia sp. RSA 990]KAJ2652086.1 mitogen activated protein kinase [Coemansia sp. RSA 1250]KAJ2675166.1 mitogen activated protein kinase [Coemansia sp. RSA 1085]
MSQSQPQSRMRLPPSLAGAYEIVRDIGQGAYGLVCEAKHIETGQHVAIKKVSRVGEKEVLAKRSLREIKLMRHFSGHENIISLLDIDVANSPDFNEIYLIQELMEADLQLIIRSGQPLTDPHYQYFLYQVCRGLKYIHSAGVLHRDLKPSNLLVNANCSLRICDFGLARGLAETPEGNIGFMTEYVATRWYRAPEIMLSFLSYTKAIDIWSVGCIFAELLGGKPLFKGRDYVDQLNQILQILGTPDDATLSRIGSERAQMYIRSLPYMPKVPWEHIFPNATPLALDLLERLLDFDPSTRITIDEILAHPYLKAYHNPEGEISCPVSCDMSFEAITSMPDVKRMIIDEVIDFKRQAVQETNEAADAEMAAYYEQQNATDKYADQGAFANSDSFAKAREYRAVDDSQEPGVAAQHQSYIGDSSNLSASDAVALERELAGDVEMR